MNSFYTAYNYICIDIWYVMESTVLGGGMHQQLYII